MHVDHGEFFRHAGRRIVQRQRVAHHADRRVRGAPRQRRGNQVGRRHQPVAVGVVLVDADRVEAALRGVFKLVHEVVVHQVGALRIEQRGMDVHPHRRVGVPEIVRQFRVGHQVEPHQLHRPRLRLACAWGGYRAVTQTYCRVSTGRAAARRRSPPVAAGLSTSRRAPRPATGTPPARRARRHTSRSDRPWDRSARAPGAASRPAWARRSPARLPACRARRRR